MPRRLFSFPSPRRSSGSLRLSDLLYPTSRSFTIAAPMIRFQLAPRLQDGAQVAEPALYGDGRREGVRGRRVVAAALVVAEEDHLVAQERSAKRAAEDVARELRLAAAETIRIPGRRRQLVVAPILEGI